MAATGWVPYLPLLKERMAGRRATAGDVAFLLQPDLKESHGSFATSACCAPSRLSPHSWPITQTWPPSKAHAPLTDIRVELHRLAQREHDKLLLQDQDQVAAALAFEDPDALMLACSTAGRQIAWVSDDMWRRRRLWDPSRTETPLPPLAVHQGTDHVDRSRARHD